MKRTWLIGSGLAMLLIASPARASEASKLFEEGVKLLDAGKVAEACPKLEESQRLEPAAGTQLNLAACYEKSGRKLLALETFRAAGDAARARGRADWARIADDHVSSLAAALPTLTITPTDPRAELELHVDDKVLRDSSVIVEPGPHTVVASSTGKKPYTVKVDVMKSTVVVIPKLEARASTTAPTPPPPPPPPPADRGMGTRRAIGLGLGVVGVAGLAFAGAGAFIASKALGEAKDNCSDYPAHCSARASGPNDRAESWSTIATVAGVAGLVLVAGGAVLYFVPSPSPTVAVSARF